MEGHVGPELEHSKTFFSEKNGYLYYCKLRVCVSLSERACTGQRHWESLERKLQTVMYFLTWVLELNSGPLNSGLTLNHQVITPALW